MLCLLPLLPDESAILPAQRVWQADLSVRALHVASPRPGGPLTVRVVLAAEGDVARAVRVEIMLPIGVGVLRLADGCHTSPSPVSSLAARVTCALGDVGARQMREVALATTALPTGSRSHVAVFAASDTPDPRPTNNFADRALP